MRAYASVKGGCLFDPEIAFGACGGRSRGSEDVTEKRQVPMEDESEGLR